MITAQGKGTGFFLWISDMALRSSNTGRRRAKYLPSSIRQDSSNAYIGSDTILGAEDTSKNKNA